MDPQEPVDPLTQRKVLSELTADTDDMTTYCYKYAVSKNWYNIWQKYLGLADGKSPGQTCRPGPVDMDTEDPEKNIWVSGHIWAQLLTWYGISEHHELDRVYAQDDSKPHFKDFEVTVLSPIVDTLSHRTKKFDLTDFVAYIECQLRKIFKIPKHKKSRLWIREKRKSPPFSNFELLLDRAEELQYSHGIDDGTMYTLALDVCEDSGVWPYGNSVEPTGSLEEFSHVIEGPHTSDFWQREISDAMCGLSGVLEQHVLSTTRQFLMKARDLTNKQYDELNTMKSELTRSLDNARVFQQELYAKEAKLKEGEQKLKLVQGDHMCNLKNFHEKQDKFNEELRHIEEMNKIQHKIIKLNVGGNVFVTSTLTLTKEVDSMFGAMFSGRHNLHLTQDGEYFIDRDGTYFRYILNYMRDGGFDDGVLPNDESILRELLTEADFYQLKGLVHILDETLRHLHKHHRRSRRHDSCSILGNLFDEDSD